MKSTRSRRSSRCRFLTLCKTPALTPSATTAPAWPRAAGTLCPFSTTSAPAANSTTGGLSASRTASSKSRSVAAPNSCSPKKVQIPQTKLTSNSKISTAFEHNPPLVLLKSAKEKLISNNLGQNYNWGPLIKLRPLTQHNHSIKSFGLHSNLCMSFALHLCWDSWRAISHACDCSSGQLWFMQIVILSFLC